MEHRIQGAWSTVPHIRTRVSNSRLGKSEIFSIKNNTQNTETPKY